MTDTAPLSGSRLAPEDRRAALARIRAGNAVLHAFASLAPLGDADALRPDGPLSGLRLGVKDIIDVAGLPTRNGSAACAAAPPARGDATAVAGLRAAGGWIVGKTTTTEFAFTDPTPCRNPHDLRRSPGGSSSGSGAAVGAGLLDAALGTQTAGSLCRPAAYCGAVGFKPSHGAVSTTGVTPLAPSFDTVGVIACSVAVARAVFDAMCDAPGATPPAGGPGLLRSGLWQGRRRASAEPAAALAGAGEALRLIGWQVADGPLEADVDAIVKAHRIVMQAEAHAAHAALLRDDRKAQLQPRFRAALEAGAGIDSSEVTEARARLAAAQRAFWDGPGAADLLLSLPVPEGAPLLDGTTGFQDWLTPWTVFGGPLLSLPWGIDGLGRPCAVMLAGAPGTDRTVLSVGAALERAGPDRVVPPLPQPGR
ncbi:amidase [Cognatishimia sp. F0-27]|uniref:amidase family protein n=1 Tax=Cognatishimia sp. F0-27 TaxID=2816855 RepID=UPI001D0C5B5A|nr:amidase [Cognatishimia sp. F0-27]MCC1494726.1 amidase [Cognatishimia sp. F0-27]